MQDQICALISQFYSPDRARASAAIDQLQGLPRTEAWLSLQQMLLAADPDTRSASALAMMLIDANRALSSIEILLSDLDQTVRLHICNMLGDFGDSRVTRSMAMLAESDNSADVRFSACFFLAHHGDERALPVLRSVMQNDPGTDYEGRPIKRMAQTAIANIMNRAGTSP